VRSEADRGAHGAVGLLQGVRGPTARKSRGAACPKTRNAIGPRGGFEGELRPHRLGNVLHSGLAGRARLGRGLRAASGDVRAEGTNLPEQRARGGERDEAGAVLSGAALVSETRLPGSARLARKGRRAESRRSDDAAPAGQLPQGVGTRR